MTLSISNSTVYHTFPIKTSIIKTVSLSLFNKSKAMKIFVFCPDQHEFSIIPAYEFSVIFVDLTNNHNRYGSFVFYIYITFKK